MIIFKLLFLSYPVWVVTLFFIIGTVLLLAITRQIRYEIVKNAVHAFLFLSWFLFYVAGAVATKGSRQWWNYIIMIVPFVIVMWDVLKGKSYD